MRVELTELVDSLPGLVWTAGPDGNPDFLNRGWLAFTGLTAERALAGGWIEAIHPEDRGALLEYWNSCLASQTPGDTEARIRRHDGAYRWFLFRANPLRDERGHVYKWVGTNVDIEDRRRAEEDLRASELSWRQIVDSIPGLVATMGPLGEVEFLNRQTLEYFGKAPSDLKNWSLVGAVHPDDLPAVVEARARSIETGEPYEVEHRCLRADGAYRWFQVRGLPVRDAGPRITAWYLLLTDIDDRKKAEEDLKVNERNLNLLINVIPTQIHVVRPNGVVVYVNKAVLDYTGLTLEDVVRPDYRPRFFHPDDLERIREERQRALTRNEPYENEQRIRGKDGRYRWFFNQYRPLLDAQGNIERWYIASFDVQDRKEAEAQLEQAYLRLAEAQRLSKTGSFITDLVADRHNWSDEAYRVFDLAPSTRITVQLVREMVLPEDLPSFDEMIARAMKGIDVDFHFRIRTPSGTLRYVRGIAHIIEQVEGRPLFIGALQDVTEAKVAEDALNAARSDLAHVARIATLNALTASIAHEVNQPLSGIITNANTCLRMLNRSPPNVEGARETALRTIRDGNRASDVIARLRALFSRKALTLDPVDLNEATEEVIALSQSELARNRVTLRCEFSDDLPSVAGDRTQLQQVILNLVRNAADAMVDIDSRPRELTIRTGREGLQRVLLSVKDVGMGLAAEAMDKLFEPFYTTKNNGMGIGLSISRSIIDAHQGMLTVARNDGPGVTFSFSLPVSDAGTHGDTARVPG
jgi:PAS domain S-box-containing protein